MSTLVQTNHHPSPSSNASSSHISSSINNQSINNQSINNHNNNGHDQSSIDYRQLRTPPEQIQISVDLLDSAQYQLQFLQVIQKSSHLFCHENVVRNAIRRYEQIWLPLQSRERNKGLVPPLDVHFVWHCHMLAPKAYEHDCEQLIGRLIDHQSMSMDRLNQAQLESMQVWMAVSNEPWHFAESYEPEQAVAYKSKCSYNLLTATHRQREFMYQISLPHYGCTDFMEISMQRYRKYLSLLQTYPGRFLTPTYDIDLMWHTHQLQPKAYARDCAQLMGELINHDDTTTDRAAKSKLSAGQSVTSKLWAHHYPNSPYARSGAMFRGHGSPGLMKVQVRDLSELSQGIVRIKSMTTEGIHLKREGLKMRLLYATRTLSTLRAQSEGKEPIPKINFDMEAQPTEVKFNFDKRNPQLITVQLELFNRTLGRKTQRCRLLAQAQLDDILPEMDSVQPQTRTELVLKEQNGNCIQQNVARLRIETLLTLDLKYRITIGKFGTLDLEPHTELYELCQASALNQNIEINQVISATHSIIDTRQNEQYSVQVVHSALACLSLIVVRDQNYRLLAKAHLINKQSCLPKRDELGKDFAAIPCVKDNRDQQQVMVVSNGLEDFCLISGKWTGFQCRVLPTEEGGRGVVGHPGKLELTEYLLIDRTCRQFDLPGGGRSLRFSCGGTQAQLTHINLNIRSVHVAESIAGVFAMSTLFVLLNPDKVRMDNNDLTLRGYMCRNWPLCVACGYSQMVPSQRFIRHDSIRSQITVTTGTGSDNGDTITTDCDENMSGGSGQALQHLFSVASCCACGADGTEPNTHKSASQEDFMTSLEPTIGAAILNDESLNINHFEGLEDHFSQIY